MGDGFISGISSGASACLKSPPSQLMLLKEPAPLTLRKRILKTWKIFCFCVPGRWLLPWITRPLRRTLTTGTPSVVETRIMITRSVLLCASDATEKCILQRRVKNLHNGWIPPHPPRLRYFILRYELWSKLRSVFLLRWQSFVCLWNACVNILPREAVWAIWTEELRRCLNLPNAYSYVDY